MTKIEKTDDPSLILKDFIDRMNLVQDPIRGYEGKPEVFMRASLEVQIEQSKAQLSVELSKIKILEAILKTLQKTQKKEKEK